VKTIYMVDNGGEYSGYQVLALFTTRELAEEYAAIADGCISEWPTDVPKEDLISWHGMLDAYKKDGKWVFHGENGAYTYSSTPTPGEVEAHCELGYDCAWGVTDPITKEYTCAFARASGKSSEHVAKMCYDAFYKKIAELEA
jgi:hypothetical protein